MERRITLYIAMWGNLILANIITNVIFSCIHILLAVIFLIIYLKKLDK